MEMDWVETHRWQECMPSDHHAVEKCELLQSFRETRAGNNHPDESAVRVSAETLNIHRFWGKLGAGQYPHDSHPAICHMLDVAHVALELFGKATQRSLQQALADRFGLSIEEAGPWIARLVGLHDLGKLSPEFQGKVDAARSTLLNQGFRFPNRNPHPHGRVTAAALPDLLQQHFGWGFAFSLAASEAVGGHHGQFDDTKSLNECEDDIGLPGLFQWSVVRQEAFRRLCAALPVDGQVVTTAQRPPLAWQILLAGLTSVADWIGSMAEYFPPAGVDLIWDDYIAVSRQRATRAVAELGWTGWRPSAEPATFNQLFPFIPVGGERPLQRAVQQLCQTLKQPTLVLVEAPMGEGKTEAAMLLADHFAVSLGQRGCYFALPTMATSNQMFQRVAAFLSTRYAADRVNLLLLHGKASLNEALRELLERGRTQRPSRIEGDQLDAGDVVAETWFTHRKRGLLAPFGVGTIDQALMAVLRIRHGFVRLFALAHKTVVIDEVHAYDVYMSHLLDRLLEWLKELGCSVVLLSATLPAKRREDLLRAWRDPNRSDMTKVAAPYPRLSWSDGMTVGVHSFDAVHRKTLTTEMIGDDVFGLATRLAGALALGGCAAVICNTVTRAQEVYLELKQHFAEGEVELFHARYPFADREMREKRVLARYGKEYVPSGEMPGIRPRSVLVSTQVVEQSLDLDFDVMVTELAPVDLVLQRAGRLQRHARLRPSGLKEPHLWISVPRQTEAGIPEWGASGFVYSPHVLFRSWLALRECSELVIPDDVELLIESVYDDRTCPDKLGEVYVAEWNRSLVIQNQEERDRKLKAGNQMIGVPGMEHLSRLCDAALSEDEHDIHPALRAQTRDARPSVTVALLFTTNEGKLCESPINKPIDLLRDIDEEKVEMIMRRSVTLQRMSVVQSFDAVPSVPHSWRTHPLLRSTHLVKLNPSTGAALDRGLRLDAELGVVFSESRQDASHAIE